MVEALYPIIGQIVVRAVGEAIRDLARGIDFQLRVAYSPRSIVRRIRARASGVSDAQMILRDALPFDVVEIFLIHRETGLLLQHISHYPDASPDSDLIGGMLTAIRDFAQDAFGRGEEGQLEEIQYGNRGILIEAAQHAYLAVVVRGLAPAGFRSQIRDRIIEIEHQHTPTLRSYTGDSTALAAVAEPLESLLGAAKPPELGPVHKAVLVGAIGGTMLCVLLACLVGGAVWRAFQVAPPLPTPVIMVVSLPPTAAPSTTPTAAPSTTPTAAPRPTASPIPSATPLPAFVPGVMTGDVFLHIGPSEASDRLGTVLYRDQPVEILAVNQNWYLVRWILPSHAQVVGWAPAEWVAPSEPIPARIVTPASGP
jgi:hypothetical protein